MSSDDKRKARRRQRYRLDEGYRVRVLELVAKNEGRDPSYLVLRRKKTSYTAAEVCALAQISDKTFDRYQRLGLIPLPTYPSGNRVYWPHQALLILRIFARMRTEGWPKVPPHFVGSKGWDTFLQKVQSQWVKEKYNGYQEGSGVVG